LFLFAVCFCFCFCFCFFGLLSLFSLRCRPKPEKIRNIDYKTVLSRTLMAKKKRKKTFFTLVWLKVFCRMCLCCLPLYAFVRICTHSYAYVRKAEISFKISKWESNHEARNVLINFFIARFSNGLVVVDKDVCAKYQNVKIALSWLSYLSFGQDKKSHSFLTRIAS
jgi:hypothetical protein